MPKAKVICATCYREFLAYTNNRKSKELFCSRQCWSQFDGVRASSKKVKVLCSTCTRPLILYPSAIRKNGNFCSRQCANVGKPIYRSKLLDKQVLHQKIEELTEKGSDEGCWAWKGSFSSSHYPIIRLNQEKMKQAILLVHRIVLSMKLDKVLSRHEFACHTCDNPPCVNPDHLFLGSSKDNAQDCARKKRNCHKLCKEDVLFIRAAPQSMLERNKLCERFNVAIGHIVNIQKGRIWKNLPWE